MQQEEPVFDSLDLLEFARIAWRRRWQIIIPTIALAIIAGVVSLLLPKIWEVEAILVPSKFLTQNQTGEFRQVLVADPKQIAGQISQGSYNSLIGAELNIDNREFPKISAENLRDTNLVRISVREKNPSRGIQILLALFNHLKSEFDKKIDVEIGSLDNQIEITKNKIIELELGIESKRIEREKTKKDIESDINKQAIAAKRITDVLEEMKAVRKRITDLDELQRKAVSEKRDAVESLALLLYSNEVQQNLRYMNTLEDKVSEERVNIEDLTFSKKSKEQQLLQIDNQISQVKNLVNNTKNEIKLFEDKKNRIDYSQLVKDPTPSFSPVSPKKKQNVLMAGFLGFCLSLGVVFFREILRPLKA